MVNCAEYTALWLEVANLLTYTLLVRGVRNLRSVVNIYFEVCKCLLRVRGIIDDDHMMITFQTTALPPPPHRFSLPPFSCPLRSLVETHLEKGFGELYDVHCPVPVLVESVHHPAEFLPKRKTPRRNVH